MSTSFTSDNLQALAKFPFTDPQWKNKFLIGSLLFLAGYAVPILPIIFVYGYCAQIMRHMIVENGPPYLPEWEDWDKFFRDGLKLFGVSLVYSLPGLIFFCGGYGLFLTMAIGMGAASENLLGDSSALVSLVPVISMAGFMGSFGLGMLLIMLGTAILPVAAVHVIATGQFSAAFRVREWWAIFRANLSGYITTYVLMLGFWMALSFVLQILYLTVVFCCLLPFVMSFVMTYLMIIASILFGQAYQVGLKNLVQPA